jgi:uncharacterized protein YndB with AHSA1/START domain
MPQPDPSPLSERQLVLVRETHVPREKLYSGWTTPELLPKWFCPKPWYVSDVKLDLRPGGTSEMIFHGPNGESFPNKGVYLELVPNEKIVFTSAFQADWEPVPQTDVATDFMFVGKVLFEPLPNGGTRYTARVVHWTKEACKKHKAMGFEQGWGIAFDQLVELVGK